MQVGEVRLGPRRARGRAVLATYTRAHSRHTSIAREDRAAFGPDPLDALRVAVDRVVTVDVDASDERHLDRLLAGVQSQVDRLTATRDRLIATRHRRRAAAAGPGREQAALRASSRQVADALRLSPGEAKRTRESGRQLLEHPDLAAAVDAGTLRPDHVRVIGDALTDTPPDVHEALTDDLLAAASTADATELGARARRRLAELDQAAAVHAERRRHARRTARVSRGPDGMLDLSGRFSGLDAETVATAIHAFRTPDPSGSPARTPEQRTADAVVAALRAAIDGTTAPADRRVKPHLMVTVDLDALARRTGAAECRWTGPIPVTELERFASTATIRVLGLDVRGLPIALSRATDHVTASQYLAFAHRDGGCRYPGCDAPSEWCDVAHAVARAAGGEVSLANALLLCRRHHRLIDEGGWTVTVEGRRATFTHPNGRTVNARPPRGHPSGVDPPDTG